MKLINIVARDLPDAWFQTIYACLDNGTEHIINRGSYEGQSRLELDYITIHIKDPGFPHDRCSISELLPHIPIQYGVPDPSTEEYMLNYLTYIMTSEVKENEQYTYGSRIWGAKSSYVTLNQVQHVIDTYKSSGNRNNQCILQVAQPSDLLLSDPLCLRHIDTRISNCKLHFIIYFRSWDVWSGMPSNLCGLQILKEYMANEIGVDDGEMICSTKGAHIYDYCWDIARKLRCR